MSGIPFDAIGAALELAGAGYPVFPCDAAKRPIVRDGYLSATTDPAIVQMLFSKPAARLIGVPTGPASGFDALDLDFRHGAGEWEAANNHRLPETRTHQTQNSGRHLLLQHAPGVRNSAGRIASGCDVRGAGGYIIVPPSPGYTVISEAPIAPWPIWLLAPGLALPKVKPTAPISSKAPYVPTSDKRLEAFRIKLLANVSNAPDGQKHERLRDNAKALGGIAAHAGFSDEEAVRWLLDALAGKDVADWKLAEKTALWGLAAGRDEPIELPERPYSGNGTRRPEPPPTTPPPTGWRPVTPDEVFEPGRDFRMNQTTGISEVYEPPGVLPPPEPPPPTPAPTATPHPTPSPTPTPVPTPPRGTPFGRLLVLGMDDLDTAPPRDYLLKGIISPNETSIWVGPPKCGKSFLLMHVAYMLALGRRVFGLRVKPTRVLYVAAEGEGGIAKRLQALRAKHGRAENFHYIAQPIDLMRDGGHSQEVITAAKAINADLIVIDTLNRALAGGNENAPEDMGAFICNVAEIRTKTRAHIAIIHHGTKASDGRNPRGHGSLEGADDALIGVQKLDGGIRTATLIHSKDDADGMRWSFKLNVVELGTDDDGDPITTLIVQETDVAPEVSRAPKPSASEQVALSCLDHAMEEKGTTATVGADHEERPVVAVKHWRQTYYAEARQDDDIQTKGQAFRRVMTALQSKGLVACRDGFVWRPDSW